MTVEFHTALSRHQTYTASCVDAQPTQTRTHYTTRTGSELEMWANAQRDGRPAEHRWRHLFNAAKFG